ncbi:hypothetical protein D1007_06656 [Hordeum vulgare]|nr:hypothetical protein D1007_06656 [Hordeum vulgare]
MLSESEEEVYLRNAGGRRLRANGKNWSTGATVDNVDDLDNISRKMLWVVEHIPAMDIIPHLPRPTWIPHLTFWSRLIMYVLQNADGAFIAHGSFMFRGRSVFRLRKELARKMRASVNVEASDILMCLPTRDARLFPLVVDLPSNSENLHIVVVGAGTPAEADLRYVDVDA